jgi:hypothetical protein
MGAVVKQRPLKKLFPTGRVTRGQRAPLSSQRFAARAEHFANQSIEPTRVGEPPLAAEVQRQASSDLPAVFPQTTPRLSYIASHSTIGVKTGPHSSTGKLGSSLSSRQRIQPPVSAAIARKSATCSSVTLSWP